MALVGEKGNLNMAEYPPQLTGRLLFLEDNDDLREACVALIEDKFGQGIKITQVSNADDALKILEVSRPDLIISDISHAGSMNGIQLFVRVRQDPALAPVPFVFVSANTPDRWYELLYTSDLRPPEGFVIKPFQPFEFLVHISRYLSSAKDITA